MHGVSLEFILMLGYAIFLALIALLLELTARHAHRRSLGASTAGFTYHSDRDIWRCPQDQHLFPIFSDSTKGVVIYRAPASACNSCRSKAACTDSNQGREIERKDLNRVKYGMKRFHRGFSLTLLLLAIVILVVELLRTNGTFPRLVNILVLSVFFLILQRVRWLDFTGAYSPKYDTHSPGHGKPHQTGQKRGRGVRDHGSDQSLLYDRAPRCH